VRSLVDTGFLVGLLDASDQWHAWAVKIAPQAKGPWLTAEACIAEAVHCLSGKALPARARLFDWLARDLLLASHALPESRELVFAEMNRYRDREVDFADACLVTLSDQHPLLPIVTTDTRDFTVYLRGRTSRKLIAPEK
jgi:predicted nucleic acid-binding protein